MTVRALRVVPDRPSFAIAVRVSRVMGRSGERFLSPEIQINGSRVAVERIGGLIDTTVGEDGVFYDLDVSGAVDPGERPGLGAALDLVRAGHLQGVVVFDLSRFSRDTAGGLRALEEIAAAGGTVLSASETIDLETPSGIFSTTVQLAANRLRRDEASKAWKATHARRFEMGLPHGKLPYGYVNSEGGAVADPALGPAVSQAFVLYAAGGVSQKQLAERLGALRGKPMRQGVVSQLLRNRFYVGELELRGEVRQGRHAPLVDEPTFAAVQRRLINERDAGPHGRMPGSAAIGIVFCSICKGPVYRRGQGQRSGVERLPALICSGKQAGTCEGIGAPRVKDVEDALRLLALEVAKRLRDRSQEQDLRNSRAVRARAELSRLQGERDALLNALGRMGVNLAKESMTQRAYDAAAGQLEAELVGVEERLHQVQGAEAVAALPLEDLESAAERLRLWWADMEPLERRAALRLFVPRVLIWRSGYRGESMLDRMRPDDEEV